MIADKFYTDPLLAKHLIEVTNSKIDFSKFDVLLEPSAGSGSFYFNLDKSKRLGLDLYPDANEILEQDFFTFKYDSNKKYITIGNPPFGRVSSMAVKFFNTASNFSEYICFIVPRTFKRVSVQNRLNLNFHLIYEENIPANSFTPSMNVKCVYQIWEHRKQKRNIVILPSFTNDFKFVSIANKDNADFAMLAYGGKCGRIERVIPTTGLRSWHFIKVINDKNVEEIIARLNSLDYSICEDTARQNSIGMKEVCELYNNKYT